MDRQVSNLTGRPVITGGVSGAERDALTRRLVFPSKAALCLGFLALALIFADLGYTSLPSFDDAYHAQTAKEMLQRGDPITITYGGSPSFQSSPLPLWITSLSYAVFGVNEFAARFPSALFGFACVALVYFFSRRYWGEDAGVGAAFILLTSQLFLRYSRHAMTEVPLAFLCTVAIIYLALAFDRPYKYSIFGLATGLAVLTKSALGLLPLIIAVPFMFLGGRRRAFLKAPFWIGVLVIVAVAAIWYVPAYLINGQFFIDSHFGAYLGMHAFDGHHADLGLWGYIFYLIWLPIQYLPWTLPLLPALVWGIRDRWNDDGLPFLFWLAIFIPVVLLTFVSTKYTRYLMPIFPAAAMLIAATVYPRLPQKTARLTRTIFGWLSIAGTIVIIILPIQLGEDRNADVKAIAPVVKQHAPEAAPVLNLGLDFWDHQNPLLFYGDRLLAQPAPDAQALWEEMKEGGEYYLLADATALAEAGGSAPGDLVLSRLANSGDVVFLSARRLGEADWQSEVSLMAPAIAALEEAPRLACYKLPKAPLGRLLRNAAEVNLVHFDETPRQLLEAMGRRGLSYGLTSVGAWNELRESPEGATVTRLLAGERLVLFRVAAPGE